MPTTHTRYGRPRGTGLDDRAQLENLAALLAANPALKPTTAIRSLGVEDPSAIRRLRDKFRLDQARLLANARQGFRSTNNRTLLRPGPAQSTSRRQLASVRTHVPATPVVTPEPAIAVDVDPLPRPPLLATWCALGLWAATTVMEQHAVLAQHWLQLPAVEIAMRGQLAAGAFLVAFATPRKPLLPRLH
jgi:hypothetical protein